MIVTPNQSQIDQTLRAFLLSVVPTGVECVRGQDNRVSEPVQNGTVTGGDFCVFWPIARSRIETNVDNLDAIGLTQIYLQPTEITYQIDVHGPNSADNVQAITTLFRDDYAVQNFVSSGFDIAPLYADEPRQVPFINAEQQLETRWSLDAHVQANQVLTTPQQSAQTLDVILIEADALPP